MSLPLFVRPLTESEISTLNEWAASKNPETRHRANVILLSASGKTAAEISNFLVAHTDSLKRWIRTFNKSGLEGITVHKRGPQGKFTTEQINKIIELYHKAPRELGFNFDIWTPKNLGEALIELNIVDSISHVTVRQILRDAGELTQSKTTRKSNSDQINKVNDRHLQDNISRTFLIDLPASNTSLKYPTTNLQEIRQAGRAALDRGDYPTACTLFQQILDITPELDSELTIGVRCWLSEALEGLGKYDKALVALSAYENPLIREKMNEKLSASIALRLGMTYARLGLPKAIAYLNEALRLFRGQEEYEGVSAAQAGLGWIYCNTYNELKIARDYFNNALEYEQLITNRRLLAFIYLTYGIVKFNEGAYSDATNHYEKALQIAKRIDDHRLLGLTLMNLGVVAAEFGKFKASAEYHSAAIDEFKMCAEINFMARTYNNLADGLIRLGKWQESEQCLKEALTIANKLGAHEEKTMALITSGELGLLQGQLDTSEKFLDQALEMGSESNQWLYVVYTQRLLAQIYYYTGRPDKAFKILRSAVQRATSIADIQNVYRCHLCLAELHFLQKGYDQAEEYLELAKEQIKVSQDLMASGHMRRLEGQLAAAKGRFAESQQNIEQSISIFKTLEDKHKLALSHLAMSVVLSQRGDVELAQPYAKKALDAFVEMGAKSDIAKAEEQLKLIQSGSSASSQSSLEINKRRPISAVSDVLLLARLIEAATSRELLLQELASILYDHFEVYKVIIWEVKMESVLPVVVYGMNGENTTSITQTFKQALQDRRLLPPGHFMQVLEDNGKVRTVLWLESKLPNGKFDLERLKPYLKQAEMGLDYANLRSLSRTSQPIEPVRSNALGSIHGFIYSSPTMHQLIEKIRKIRTSDVTVLITGESGTGKELVAHAVHAESGRRDNVFLPFNCTTSTPEMIDSQLFGYRKGAFTGAYANHTGIIRAADNGTLFLDEIGDLALEIQPKLLRFLQEGEIQPIGEIKPINVDVRVIAATNADLERAVKEGRFREDLYYRLNIIHLHVPPLRDRREEIPILAAHFLEHFATRNKKKDISFSRESLHALSAYSWPGNVRQLKTEIQRVLAYTGDGDIITPTELSPEITSHKQTTQRNTITENIHLAGKEQFNSFNIPRFSLSSNEVNTSLPQNFVHFPKNKIETGYAKETNLEIGNREFAKNRTLREVTEETERKLILETLESTGYNVSQTAQQLGVSRKGLKLKMDQLGIGIDLSRAQM